LTDLAATDAGREELRSLVARLAADRSAWNHLVRHDPGQRRYEQLLLNERVGVWLICWMDDHDTGFHDHDVSSGAVGVVQGLLLEERMRVGREPASRVYSPGEIFDFRSSDIHRMAHAGGGPAVSLHAYSPPLNRMGAYAVDELGVLTRTSISYEEELRPAQTA
jgi:predicted metal-dependent enzyme (double-stranded beta helix superfamily)